MALRWGLALVWIAACGERTAPAPAPAVDGVWKQAFAYLDSDGDGFLNRREFGASGRRGQRHLAADLDRDGGIDLGEWVALVVRHPPRYQRNLRTPHGGPPPMSAVTILLDEAVAERTALLRRQGTGVRRDGAPNILMVGLDTVRADHLSPYGSAKDTSPNLSALAARGVVFENSIANANESLYSHAAIWTSRYASEVAKPVYETYVVPDSAKTLAEVLQAYGYATGGFVAGGHLDGDFGHAQGFDTYKAEVGFGSFWNTIPAFLSWLDQRDPNQPWFAFVHSYDAHAPYQTLPAFAHAFADAPSALVDRLLRKPMFPERIMDRRYYPGRGSFFHHPKGFNILGLDTYRLLGKDREVPGIELSEADVAHMQAHYDGCIRYADMQFGVLLAALEGRGSIDNTLVIVLSDHGEDLLDHSFVNHRTGLFDSIIRVPTVVSGPGFAAGQRVASMVQALDFLPTVVRAAGGVSPAGARGRPLQDVAAGTAPPLDAVFSEGVMDQLSVRTPTHKLIASGFPLDASDLVQRLVQAPLPGTGFALFHLITDPLEQQDLLQDPAPEALAEAQRLRAGLIRWRADLALGTAMQDPSAIDPAVAEQMRRHGYWKPAAGGP
jgi:arylsulfatase A-like enzyme